MDYLRCGMIMDLINNGATPVWFGRAPEFLSGNSPDFRSVTILWFALDCHAKTIEFSNMLIEGLYMGAYRWE